MIDGWTVLSLSDLNLLNSTILATVGVAEKDGVIVEFGQSPTCRNDEKMTLEEMFHKALKMGNRNRFKRKRFLVTLNHHEEFHQIIDLVNADLFVMTGKIMDGSSFDHYTYDAHLHYRTVDILLKSSGVIKGILKYGISDFPDKLTCGDFLEKIQKKA